MQLIFIGCGKSDSESPDNMDYRQEMRDLVIDLGTYAKSFDSGFLIIPQNGQELFTDNGEAGPNSVPKTAYLHALDATGRESMLYGYHKDDQETRGSKFFQLFPLYD